MAFSLCLKQSSVVIGALGLASLGSLALATPAHAFSFDTWTPIGDVVQSGNSATLTNAITQATADLQTPPEHDDFPGPNLNQSGIDPLLADGLETALGLPAGSLGLDATEGSAISTLLSSINIGDTFSFDWNFSVLDSIDRGFVAIDDTSTAGLDNLFDLTGASPFSYLFGAAGNYQIAIGVVDVNDFVTSSVLNVSNAELQQAEVIPTPALLPGLVGMGIAALRKRKQASVEPDA